MRVHAKIMADDRILRFADSYSEVVHQALVHIAGLPRLAWDRLAGIMLQPCHWRSLRSQCQAAAATCAGFLLREVFSFLREQPWCLTQGLIGWNLHELQATPELQVKDETSQKIRALLIAGYDQEVGQALDLLRDASCTVNVVEQAHGSGAQLARYHHYGEFAMVYRSSVHKLRHLFMPCPLQLALHKLQLRIDRLEHASPEQIGGRQMCHRMFFNRLRWQQVQGTAEVHRAQDVMRRSHTLYDQLQPREKLRLDEAARLSFFFT